MTQESTARQGQPAEVRTLRLVPDPTLDGALRALAASREKVLHACLEMSGALIPILKANEVGDRPTYAQACAFQDARGTVDAAQMAEWHALQDVELALRRQHGWCYGCGRRDEAFWHEEHAANLCDRCFAKAEAAYEESQQVAAQERFDIARGWIG